MPFTAPADAGPEILAAQFEEAWNSHDMAAFAEIFDANATFVSRFGHYWQGREPIVERHAEIHATFYSQSSISNRIQDVDVLGPDCAVVFVQSLVTVGDAMPVGPRAFSTEFMFVAQRQDGVWRMRAASNVALADPQSGALLVAEEP